MNWNIFFLGILFNKLSKNITIRRIIRFSIATIVYILKTAQRNNFDVRVIFTKSLESIDILSQYFVNVSMPKCRFFPSSCTQTVFSKHNLMLMKWQRVLLRIFCELKIDFYLGNYSLMTLVKRRQTKKRRRGQKNLLHSRDCGSMSKSTVWRKRPWSGVAAKKYHNLLRNIFILFVEEVLGNIELSSVIFQGPTLSSRSSIKDLRFCHSSERFL